MLDANRLRYIDVTDQVRRMPVALVLVVDQMFVQDVLACYANSPLRFQVTQYHWKRFRGTLDSPGGATLTGGGSPFGPGGPPGAGGSPFGGSPGGPSEGGAEGGSPGPGGMPGGFGSGSSAPAVAEEQVTSGLVELSLYGIVTLYERYEVAAPAAPAPADAPPPQPAAPTTPAPTAGTPPTAGKP